MITNIKNEKNIEDIRILQLSVNYIFETHRLVKDFYMSTTQQALRYIFNKIKCLKLRIKKILVSFKLGLHSFHSVAGGLWLRTPISTCCPYDLPFYVS